MLLPLMRFRTLPKQEEIKCGKSCSVVLDVSVYSKSDNEFCGVILRDAMYEDGFVKTSLLKYIMNVNSYDEILDIIDDFLNDSFDEN